MTYDVELCNTFFASLRDAPLNTLVLYYPESIDADDLHPQDFSTLLASPCLANLESLKVERLRFEYLALPCEAAVPRFLNMDRLELGIVLDDQSPSRRAIGMEFLTLFPHLSSLEIAIHDVRHISHELKHSDMYRMFKENQQAPEVKLGAAFHLSRLSASLTDILLLGLRCPKDEMEITKIDSSTLTFARPNLMPLLFPGDSAVPPKLSVAFSEADDAPLWVLTEFLTLLRVYWAESPQGHVRVPQEINLNARILHRGAIEPLLVSSVPSCMSFHRSYRHR